jgi:hypothetical protein
MELVQGAPLKGPLPLQPAVEYAGQILDALDAAHRKGIIHRDLKPGNILVTKQGVKLLDFGLAKLTATPEDTATTLSGEGEILGTMQYMAPEALQGKQADARSDLFSFGCLLYEILTGKRAFEGDSSASVIGAILHGEPAAIEVEPPLGRVLHRCLAKDPDQRFQNALDLKTALTWAAGERSATPVRPTPRRGWWAGAAALVFVFGALAGWALRRFEQPAAEERVLRFNIDPPEGGRFTFGQNAGGIAISPDGRTAAYVAGSYGKTGLWVRPLDGADARLIPGTESAEHPFWSPDSRSIAFFAGRKLWRVDLAGGLPLAVCDAPGFDRAGTWSNDGRILLGTVWRGLQQVPASGGTPTPLTVPDAAHGEAAHRWPQALPGGRFLYWVQNNTEGLSAVYASSFAKPAERVRLTASESQAVYAAGYLLWLRGDTLVAQDFDLAALKLSGEPHSVASPVSRIGMNGQINVSAANGMLLYFAARNLSQLTWFDRTGNRSEWWENPASTICFVSSRTNREGMRSTFSLSPSHMANGRSRLVAAASPSGAPAGRRSSI